jgi:hypothetical protein
MYERLRPNVVSGIKLAATKEARELKQDCVSWPSGMHLIFVKYFALMENIFQ